MDGENCVRSQPSTGHRSEPKKRRIMEVEEAYDSLQKRVKMRDLESVFRSEAQAERGETNTPHPNICPDSRPIDLNANVGSVNGLRKAKGLDLDLNAEDISSSINDPFYPYKKYEKSSRMDDFECGSSVGPLVDRDSMRVWKGLKQNNYMSNHRGVPVSLPKPRGRKKFNSHSDVMKKRMELAKKEQVDRFARVAAPSGLLNGLNPGIINHVRNSKQVHSIIEALVRSERNEKELSGSKKGNQELRSSGIYTSGLSREETLLGRRKTGDYGLFSKSIYPNTDFSKMPPSQCNIGNNEDDKLALKLSVGAENNSCLSNDESGNLGSVDSLSLKAANVASQWLELLNQDIKGRLAALRRSKKRVRSVITTELPLLISREFSANSQKPAANEHSVRWSTLFSQMDKSLSEEEIQMESWLNQVKEMQLHCEKGLYKNSLLQQKAPLANDSRLGAVDNTENDLAVRAAAASIYSTCNFLLSTENLPCC
ncbi:hypothetical protein ABFS83_06G060900 [Erythranthe nasuta]